MPKKYGTTYKAKEGKNPGERSAGDPLELLPQDSRRSPAVAVHEHKRGKQEINPQTGQVEPVEKNSRADRGHEAQFAKSHEDTHQTGEFPARHKSPRVSPLPFGGRTPLRKHQREMQQQRGLQQSGHNAGPINFPVEGAQLARVLKGIQDEGNQAKNVEMHGASGVPAARRK